MKHWKGILIPSKEKTSNWIISEKSTINYVYLLIFEEIIGY